jgi:hypothetical protein
MELQAAPIVQSKLAPVQLDHWTSWNSACLCVQMKETRGGKMVGGEGSSGAGLGALELASERSPNHRGGGPMRDGIFRYWSKECWIFSEKRVLSLPRMDDGFSAIESSGIMLQLVFTTHSRQTVSHPFPPSYCSSLLHRTWPSFEHYSRVRTSLSFSVISVIHLLLFCHLLGISEDSICLLSLIRPTMNRGPLGRVCRCRTFQSCQHRRRRPTQQPGSLSILSWRTTNPTTVPMGHHHFASATQLPPRILPTAMIQRQRTMSLKISTKANEAQAKAGLNSAEWKRFLVSRGMSST